MVMLTPEQQQTFLADHPAMFEAGPGAWGRSGSTWVNLDAADEDTVGEAVTLAWQNAAAKAAVKNKPKRTVAKKRTPAGKKPAATRKRSRR